MNFRIEKIIPILVILLIGYHATDALSRRLTKLIHFKSSYTTQSRMQLIVDRVKLVSIGEENFQINDLKDFISHYLKGDTSQNVNVDGWDTPFRFSSTPGQFTLFSAGPDRKFQSEDDIQLGCELTQY